MTFNKTLQTATLLALGGFAAMSANAADTSEFGITTTITSVCTVDASGATITFTDIAAGTAVENAAISNKQSAGDIKVMCSNGAPYVINLSTAGNSESTTGEGLMTGAVASPDSITYQLYSDALGTKVWGNTGTTELVGNGVSGTGTGVSTELTHSVYASIKSTTDVKQDTYTDTITASIIY